MSTDVSAEKRARCALITAALKPGTLLAPVTASRAAALACASSAWNPLT